MENAAFSPKMFFLISCQWFFCEVHDVHVTYNVILVKCWAILLCHRALNYVINIKIWLKFVASQCNDSGITL